MIFNSVNYLLFFFAVALVYFALPHRFRWVLIILASLFFYMSFVPLFALLIVSLIVPNYFLALRMGKTEEKWKNRLFIAGVLANMFILVFFKFSDFFRDAARVTGINWRIFDLGRTTQRWVIPLGLSYFTLTILAYLLEVKRGRITAEGHLGVFSAYLLFFPKIAQGPIERPQHLIPQFYQRHHADFGRIVEGLKLMAWGFFKKLVVADRMAIYVNAVFDNFESHNGITLAVAAIFYSFQIYADFSGYTDIALGSASILGFRLSRNFNRPYLSASIRDFWNRWHISFSTWLRDYIFLPLAFHFSRKMSKASYLAVACEKWIYFFAVMITFALAGMWHGEGSNFLAWGLLFGFYLTCSKWTDKARRKLRKKIHLSKFPDVSRALRIGFTFALVTLTWIFFRAPDLSSAVAIVGRIFSKPGSLFLRSGEEQQFLYAVAAIVFLAWSEIRLEVGGHGDSHPKSDHWFKEQLFYVLILMLILLVGVFDGGQFIYFQF